jgi:hypothetical protein
MKLEEAKTTFYQASALLSENARKLCFAGIAIVWIFKVGNKDSGGIAFSRDLLCPLGAFVLGLTFDVLQYLYKSTVWWIYFEVKHRSGVADDDEVDPPGILNAPTTVFFYTKVVCCGTGFYWLLLYILHALRAGS